MTAFLETPSKMLLCFVGRHRGEKLVEVAKAAGARGGTIALGNSLGNNKLLQALSLGDVHQDMVVTIMGSEREAVVNAVRDAAEKDPKRLSGIALVLDVPRHFYRANTPNIPETTQDRSTIMESGYKLISVIVNTGYGDDVMAAARGAGASGGTILNARGTGTEDDVKFFGITLVPEKEMLLIVAEQAKVESIVKAIGTVPKLSEPGGGIVFTMNVEEFILLGQHKDWKS